MALKATFTTGSNTTTVTGLYQWDYGQELEIESGDLETEIVEIHFASSKMSEAIVRSCAFTNGVGSVTIPDICLEQQSTITAWIYRISDTQGHTLKTITLPITARVRPSKTREIPAEVSDRYTELITEVNETIEALEKGSITVAKSVDATNANHAASAGNAATANYATSAGSSLTSNVLNLNRLEYLNTTVPSSFNFTAGRIYVITASYPGKSKLLETMVLSPSTEETDNTWYSSKSAHDCFCYCDYNNALASWLLKFSHGDGTDTYVPSSVYIREI